jgi:hypothetical protein
MSRGIVLFGVNNSKVDYVQLAVMAAAFIRKNMPGIPIALITDEDSRNSQLGKHKWKLDNIDRVILLPKTEQRFENSRVYRDTKYHGVESTFKNETRSSVYSLSPFDETLLIDVDYLVCNGALNAVWGNDEEVMINRDATSLLHTPMQGHEFRLNLFGIRMYWATVIYFRKGDKAKLLFDLVDFIKENWQYYVMLYEIPGTLFRNDYAFSIAIHILNGFVDGNDSVSPLPIPSILTSLDTDQFFAIHSPTDLSLFANDPAETWKFYVTRLSGVNVHCMNKLSLLNNMDAIMETLS